MNRHLEAGKSVVLLLADGGPDRNMTFASVQAPLLAVFKRSNLDMLVVCRTIPKQSYNNPVERCMSTLNIGLQNVALSRKEMTPAFESAMKRCNSMADIRAVGATTEGFEEAFAASIGPSIEIIEGRFEQLGWTGRTVEVLKPCSAETLAAIEKVLVDLDPEFFATLEGVIAQNMQRSEVFKDLYKHHVRLSLYCFQVRKIIGCKCKACAAGFFGPLRMPLEEYKKIDWLPLPILKPAVDGEDKTEPHFKTFDEVFGGEPDSSGLPSGGRRGKKAKGTGTSRNRSEWSSSSVRFIVPCSSCSKQRCVLSEKALTKEQRALMKEALDDLDYVCGSELLEEDHVLKKVLYLKESLSCIVDMESQFFSCKVAGREVNICGVCGLAEAELLQPPNELVQQYAWVRPLCSNCKAANRDFPHGKKKGGGRKRKERPVEKRNAGEGATEEEVIIIDEEIGESDGRSEPESDDYESCG